MLANVALAEVGRGASAFSYNKRTKGIIILVPLTYFLTFYVIPSIQLLFKVLLTVNSIFFTFETRVIQQFVRNKGFGCFIFAFIMRF